MPPPVSASIARSSSCWVGCTVKAAAVNPFDFAKVADFVGELHTLPDSGGIAIRDNHIAYCNIVKSGSE